MKSNDTEALRVTLCCFQDIYITCSTFSTLWYHQI